MRHQNLYAMSKVIVTTEEELEALIKKVLNDVLSPLLMKGDTGVIKSASEIMSLKQASEFLDLAPQTLYGHTSRRTIPHYKKGKKIYFKREELLEWLTQSKRKTTAELLVEWEENQSQRRKRRN